MAKDLIKIDDAVGVVINVDWNKARKEILDKLRPPVVEATEMLAAKIRQEAPVATRHTSPYPRTKDSIVTTYSTKFPSGRVESRDHKSGWINIGTGERSTHKGWYRGVMPANPFFRRSAEMIRDRILAVFKGVL